VRILVGDVGGTHVRFAAAERQDGAIRLTNVARLRGDDFGSFEAALATYLATSEQRFEGALFALAGPIEESGVTLTNRAWRVDVANVRRVSGVEIVRLRNDFAAMARGAPVLPAASFATIRDGLAEPSAPILVAGPGTGFGMAALLSDGDGWRVLPGEGGHQAFAAQSPFEWEVASRLRQTGFVSIERVCAGIGFGENYAAIRDVLGLPPDPHADPRLVSAGTDSAAQALAALRASCILSACGDAALAYGARGGVVIAGGVAEHLQTALRQPSALARFLDRGPMSDYVARIPIRLLTDAHAPLVGAAALYFDDAR